MYSLKANVGRDSGGDVSIEKQVLLLGDVVGHKRRSAGLYHQVAIIARHVHEAVDGVQGPLTQRRRQPCVAAQSMMNLENLPPPPTHTHTLRRGLNGCICAENARLQNTTALQTHRIGFKRRTTTL